MKVASSLVFLSSLAFATAGKLGRVNKKALLSKAIPVNSKGQPRRLDEAAAEEEAIAVTVDNSIQFNSCISLSTSLSNDVKQMLANDADLLASWQSGEIVAAQSYVLFSICETAYCSYGAEDSLYMVDLATYMNLAGYKPSQTMNYCNACEEAADWCLYGQYENQDDAAAEGDDAAAEGGRFLNAAQEYVDCNTCQERSCFDAEAEGDEENADNQADQVNIENIVGWVQNMAQCQETGVAYNDNYNMYSQFMCNSAGSGVEIGIFLDQDCTVYTNKQSYGGLFPNDVYSSYSTDIVTYPFLSAINCAADVEYQSPENAANGDDGNQDQNEEEQEVNEYCQQLIESDWFLPLDNCAYGQDQNNNNNNQNAEEENDDTGYFQDYTYELDVNYVDNAYEVCETIHILETSESSSSGNNKKSSSGHHNVFSSDNTLYDYSARNAKPSNGGAGKAVGITFLVLALVGALAFVGMKYMNNKKDSKKQPLVDGALA